MPYVVPTGVTQRPAVLWACLAALAACLAVLPPARAQAVVPDTAVADTTVVGAPADAAADTAAARLQATLDSLRADVAALRASAASQAPAEADTAAALRPADRLRETAEDVRNLGLNTLWALIVFVAAFYFIKAVIWFLEVLAERNAARRLFYKKLIPIVRLLTWIVTVYYVVAGVYGIDRRSLLAAGAALGVAVGFAAQDVLKNIFGGIIIIFDQPFQVGDKISVGGTYGEVVSIGLRSTRLTTPDDNLVSVPNSQVVEGQVSNANAGALDCQVVTNLYLPGWIDVMKAKRIAYHAAANSKYVYLDKPIVVNVKDEFDGTFLTHLVVKAYVLDTRYEFAFASDVTETAKAEFLREGMLEPFGTQLDVRLHRAAPSNGTAASGEPLEEA